MSNTEFEDSILKEQFKLARMVKKDSKRSRNFFAENVFWRENLPAIKFMKRVYDERDERKYGAVFTTKEFINNVDSIYISNTHPIISLIPFRAELSGMSESQVQRHVDLRGLRGFISDTINKLERMITKSKDKKRFFAAYAYTEIRDDKDKLLRCYKNLCEFEYDDWKRRYKSNFNASNRVASLSQIYLGKPMPIELLEHSKYQIDLLIQNGGYHDGDTDRTTNM